MKYKEIRPQKGFQDRFVSSSVDIAIGGGAAGVGKMQPFDAQVLTPFGFVDMGSLKIGSQIINPSGKTQRVIQIFEHGEQDVYRLFFSDGSSTESGLDHLWLVRNSRARQKMANDAFFQDDNFFKGRIMTTREIIAFLDNQKENPEKYNANYHLLVPLVKPVHFNCGERAKLLIHPYLLGVLLGDGCITGKRNISITNADPEIIDKLRSLGYDITKYNSKRDYDYGLRDTDGAIEKELQRIGLLGTRSNTKFLPKQCRWLSVENKLLLMQGLMDTDGYVDAGGSMVYTTVSKQLATDIQWIVRSLGGKATIVTKEPTYTYNGEKRTGQLAYNLFINSPINPQMVSLKRKKDRTSHLYNGGNAELANRIVRYEYAGRKECRCITVDNPNRLYVTDDFIVTHNTSASVLSLAYYINNPAYRALYVRKNLGELKGGGSMMEEFQKMYPKEIIARTTMTDNPEVEFISGCKVIMTHMADENPKNINERVKGWQYDFIYLDELTAYQWSTFTYLLSRNRGSSGEKPILRATTNPKKNSWVRRLLDWYIGEDGLIDPERDGVVRYMYYAGGSVDDIVWGNSKEEVYAQVKERIDRQMKASKTEYLSPYDFIKSFVFMSGKLGDNKELMKTQPEYAGNLAMAGGVLAEQLLEGNWNVDEQDDAEVPVSREMAESIFYTDSNDIGGRYITADIAMGGEDNMVLLAWYGFHIQDSLVMSGRDLDAPTVIAVIRRFQQKHDVGDFNVIYDSASVGSFVGGYIRGAVAYHSNRSPIGSRGKTRYHNLKSQCTEKLIEMIKYGMISVNPEIANKPYRHANIKKPCTFKEELITESTVIRFLPITETGKLRTLEKKEMGRLLGKGRSPDIIDNLIMRMSIDTDFSSFSEPRDIMQPQGQEAFFEDSGITLQQFLEWA